MHFTQNTVSRPVSPVRKRYHSCHMSVFFPRRQPAPDMSLGLIDVQNLPRLLGERWIDLHKPVCDILMYSAFRHPKCLGCLPHSGIGFNDIIRNADSTLFNVILQKNTPQESFLQCMKDS